MADQRMMTHELVASGEGTRLESGVRENRPSEALLEVVRALAKRHAREDYAAEIAARNVGTHD
jgi:hypothetical protein